LVRYSVPNKWCTSLIEMVPDIFGYFQSDS
jgi:hypothetical protein